MAHKASVFKVMDVQQLIERKRDGKKLEDEEIKYFIDMTNDGKVSVAQIGAMLMAMYIRDLDDDETVSLTKAMIGTGDVMQWPDKYKGMVVDKHSTGGVGDKISLVLVPALAACGVKVPMISGRGLNHTGGTLDKLNSIEGFNVALTRQEIRNAVEKVGCCITGPTEDIAPADKILYGIRDETCTVNNDGLITGSIISKKASESLNALVLDVKVGKGALRKDVNSARTLAQKLIKAGNSYGVHTVAILTRMDTPLGNMIGNALEVVETIKCLHGEGPSDLIDLVVRFGGELLHNTGKADNDGRALSLQETEKMVESTLKNGEAIAKFCEMMKEQGVEDDFANKLCQKGTDVFEILPKSIYTEELKAATSGHVHDIDAKELADVSFELGAGRKQATDTIKFAVGLELLRSVGEPIKEGEPWIKIHHDNEDGKFADRLRDKLTMAIQINKTKTLVKMEEATRVIEVVRD